MQWPGYTCLTWWLWITASLASAGSQPVSNTRIFSSRRTRFWHPMAWPIVPQPCSSKCYSWNHDTVQFHSEYSPDGRLFARWSDTGSLVQVWDTRTGQSVGKFPTFLVYAMTLSPTLIQHSLGDRLIALWHRFRNTISIPAICSLGSRVEDTHCVYTRWNQFHSWLWT